MWDRDEIESRFDASIDAFRDGDFIQAERILNHLKQTADNAVRNRAGLYLAVVYMSQHIPGVRGEENRKWLARSKAESREVLENNPTTEHRYYAEAYLR